MTYKNVRNFKKRKRKRAAQTLSAIQGKLTLLFLVFETIYWNPVYLYFMKLAFELFLSFKNSCIVKQICKREGRKSQGTKSLQ